MAKLNWVEALPVVVAVTPHSDAMTAFRTRIEALSVRVKMDGTLSVIIPKVQTKASMIISAILVSIPQMK